MTVVLTISKTAAGPDAADALAGGAHGLNYGQTVAGSYCPLVNQAANTGQQDLYLYHDAAVDPITSVKFYVVQYTGVYGGADTAANDIATLLALGAADSGTTKNNTDFPTPLSRGLHMDMSWNVPTSNQFDYARETSGQMRIFGKDYSGFDGSGLGAAFLMHVDACSYWNGTAEVDASAPVAGQIGKASDTVLGNRGHIKKRFYLHGTAAAGGIIQFDEVCAYSYSA